jgi:hypothetical protein
MWVPFNKHGYYAFFFKKSDYDKHRMRISRSDEEIEKEILEEPCPVCHEKTTIYLMKKASALKFKKLSPELTFIKPGDMRLPGEETTTLPTPGSPIPSIPDFIEIESPLRLEKVYSLLIDETNACYEYEAYSSALVMLRKLIENLLVDILRMKYGPTGEHDFYFDRTKKQFLPLSVLVTNLESIASEYEQYGLTRTHLGIVKGLRKDGNRSAHSIIDLVDKRKMDSLKSNANQAVTILLMIIGISKGLLNDEGKPIQKRRK